MTVAERSRRARKRRERIAWEEDRAFADIREMAERGLSLDVSDPGALEIAREALEAIEVKVITLMERRDEIRET